jgi:hypothetical protein
MIQIQREWKGESGDGDCVLVDFILQCTTCITFMTGFRNNFQGRGSQGLYSEMGFRYGLERNFACSWRRPSCRSQVIDLSLSALVY